ncbi:PepSY-associated TM helix domain-containing protein [Prosthecodimorpha hirschii]|uniref:PepSY-associated TM helix domain-containing protein n=1 Tax=Prosthecodimorpha hirschii TaxID=665126 RepID=UPI001FEE1427|nr:PepSY-associated TM helix domain-containing protein [Prosthecomicrobium hirschii]
MKPLFLRLHRWISLAFALPLLVVIATGLILSFEPIVQSGAIRPGSITVESLTAALAKADPDGKATGIVIRPWENSFGIGFGASAKSFDLATGAPVAPGGLSGLFGASRGIHERLLFDLGWLVTASTVAMLVIVALGVLMGLPRLRNTVSGWHKGTAWFLLPLVVLSPLTGLALALGVTFTTPLTRPAGPPVSLVQAIAKVAEGHDLSGLNSIRSRAGTPMARLWEGGELKAYSVAATGLTPIPRNWPRLLHEGNGAGLWTGLVDVVTSLALLGLLGTGVTIWARRATRRPTRVRAAA